MPDEGERRGRVADGRQEARDVERGLRHHYQVHARQAALRPLRQHLLLEVRFGVWQHRCCRLLESWYTSAASITFQGHGSSPQPGLQLGRLPVTTHFSHGRDSNMHKCCLSSTG